MMSLQPQPLKGTIPSGHPFFDIIEEAYRVFDYPKPSSLEVCQHCCMDAAIEADFLNPPIRLLPLEYVRDWYYAAYDPEKGVVKATWAYLLPRLLEILATGENLADVGLEVSLSRFETGNQENWSDSEWAVIDRFQREFLQYRISDDNDFLDDVICMFRLAGWPLTALIEQVVGSSNENLAVRFWNDWCAGRVPGKESIWITGFWNNPDNSKILDFYTSDALYEKMEVLALDDQSDPELAAKASAVADLMRP